jgi:hypothetical protein
METSMSASPSITLLKRLVPRPIKGAIRRVVERQTLGDALRQVARLPSGDVPSRALLEDLQRGWANDGMVARTDYLAEVCGQAVRTTGPILECGSGLTTLLLGLLAGRRGVETWTLEHLPEWHRVLMGSLARHHVPNVHLLLTPLRSFGAFTWYDPPLAVMPPRFNLIVCDGPPSDTSGGRYGVLPLLGDRLAPNAILLLDDAERPNEAEVLRRWHAERAMVTSIRETPSGTYALAVVDG